MAMGTFNNNQYDNRPTVTVYTPISFSNPDSTVQASRFSISYFNRMMCLSIALPLQEKTAEGYTKYNNDNQIKIYLSYRQAKLLHDAILDMFETGKNNVCIETKNGLLKVSNGIEFGSDTPCISVSYASDNDAIVEVVYQTKANDTVAYDYSDGQFSTMSFPKFEIETFIMVLEQYYLASSYAIAASVHESSMYREKGSYELLKAIAGKVGAPVPQNGNNNRSNFNSHTFLGGNGNGGSNNNSGGNASSVHSYNNQASGGGMNGIPKGYDQTSFDDIVNSRLF